MMARRKMPARDKEDIVIEEPLIELEPVEDAKNSPIKLVISNCKVLNVRKEPNRESKILFQIPQGGTVIVDELVDDWMHICEYLDKQVSGYILAQYAFEA
jgi:hypothetical protein